jgi:2,3-dihydroxy-p-cumate/2,3-dihydroxybenzoate 3,4-dioxygenase
MPRYSQLGYAALNVSDVARAAAFYEQTVGLMPNGRGAQGEAFFRCGPEHHNIVLYPAASPGLKRIGIEMEDDAALDELQRHLAAQQVQIIDVPAPERDALHEKRALRIAEPSSGAVLEFYSGMARAAQPFAARFAKIRRIGHVVLRVPDLAATADFYTRVLGFRVSDEIDGQAVFMRPHPSPYHHGIALFQGSAAKLHHVNFMVSEIDDIGRAMDRFARNNVRIVYGPGRHRPSDSFYLYFLEPDGLTLEYSFEMEEFPARDARAPRNMVPNRTSTDFVEAVWEAGLPPKVGDIERLALPQ